MSLPSATGTIRAAIRYWPVRIGDRGHPALLLGPVAVQLAGPSLSGYTGEQPPAELSIYSHPSWIYRPSDDRFLSQVAHDGTRKAVLSRADGIVFVADSDRSQETNNGEAFQSMADNCHRVGLDFEHIPLVVQFNKRDLPGAVPEAEIRERWEAAPWPLHFAVALSGDGVEATFESLLRALYRRHDAELGLAREHGVGEQAFVAGILGRP